MILWRNRKKLTNYLLRFINAHIHMWWTILNRAQLSLIWWKHELMHSKRYANMFEMQVKYKIGPFLCKIYRILWQILQNDVFQLFCVMVCFDSHLDSFVKNYVHILSPWCPNFLKGDQHAVSFLTFLYTRIAIKEWSNIWYWDHVFKRLHVNFKNSSANLKA